MSDLNIDFSITTTRYRHSVSQKMQQLQTSSTSSSLSDVWPLCISVPSSLQMLKSQKKNNYKASRRPWRPRHGSISWCFNSFQHRTTLQTLKLLNHPLQHRTRTLSTGLKPPDCAPWLCQNSTAVIESSEIPFALQRVLNNTEPPCESWPENGD